MLFLLVLLLWTAAAAYVPFHFRKSNRCRSFFRGFTAVWYALATAESPDQDKWMGDDACMDSGEKGVILGVISVAVAGLCVLIFAGFTLHLAW